MKDTTPDMDWEDLRHFQALAESGTLSGAARILGVTHTTVSRRIARLEERGAAPLFDRGSDGFRLTAMGEAVMENTRRIAENVSAIRDAVDLTIPYGTVRVSATDTVAEEILCAGLDDFHAAHPDIRLTVLSTHRNADLAHHEAHIALRLARPTEGDFIIRRVGSLAYGLYAVKGGNAADDMKGGPLVGYTEEYADLPESRWLARHFPDAHYGFRSDAPACLLRAIEAGMGIGLLPRLVGARSHDLVEVTVEEPAPEREVWAVMRKGSNDAPRVRAVLAHISARFRKSG